MHMLAGPQMGINLPVSYHKLRLETVYGYYFNELRPIFFLSLV